ncbi:hypothetical protein LV75_006826 [Actinokineospora diospyrosa]|uniref:Uncharacterized protein n=1 Tax=Actinokineospora diospyrosa TaxID=103728 RepID=A0ABT1INP9_9PSEU|nr:hypothetical protein [Actinokineospora diospyrosa]
MLLFCRCCSVGCISGALDSVDLVGVVVVVGCPQRLRLSTGPCLLLPVCRCCAVGCIWGLSIRLILTSAVAGGAGQGIRASAFGSGGRLVAWRQHRRETRQCDELDGANLFCAGPLQHPWQDRKAGAQKQALPRGNATGVVPPRKTSPPHRAGLAPATPTVQALSRWVGADLTGGKLAPPGPTVQALSWQSRRGRAGLAPAASASVLAAGDTRLQWLPKGCGAAQPRSYERVKSVPPAGTCLDRTVPGRSKRCSSTACGW